MCTDWFRCPSRYISTTAAGLPFTVYVAWNSAVFLWPLALRGLTTRLIYYYKTDCTSRVSLSVSWHGTQCRGPALHMPTASVQCCMERGYIHLWVVLSSSDCKAILLNVALILMLLLVRLSDCCVDRIDPSLDSDVCRSGRSHLCRHSGYNSTAIVWHYPRTAPWQRLLRDWIHMFHHPTASLWGQEMLRLCHLMMIIMMMMMEWQILHFFAGDRPSNIGIGAPLYVLYWYIRGLAPLFAILGTLRPLFTTCE